MKNMCMPSRVVILIVAVVWIVVSVFVVFQLKDSDIVIGVVKEQPVCNQIMHLFDGGIVECRSFGINGFNGWIFCDGVEYSPAAVESTYYICREG